MAFTPPKVGRRLRASISPFFSVCVLTVGTVVLVLVCINTTKALRYYLKIHCKRTGCLRFCVQCVHFFFLFFFNLTYSRWTSSLPSCLWSQRIFPSLPGSRLTIFLSRCKFSTLTTSQPMVEFYLLTFPRFPLRKKEHKSYFGKNRTHDFRASRCAGYLLDHPGDEHTDLPVAVWSNTMIRRFRSLPLSINKIKKCAQLII